MQLEKDSSWYVLCLHVDIEKFLHKYGLIHKKTKDLVDDLVYFKKPDKGLYERDSGNVFVGYVFAKIATKNLRAFHSALMKAELGEILGYKEGQARPLTDEEMSRVLDVMKNTKTPKFRVGQLVKITNGPYEGMVGAVSSQIGQTVMVKVALRRTESYAEVSLDSLEVAA